MMECCSWRLLTIDDKVHNNCTETNKVGMDHYSRGPYVIGLTLGKHTNTESTLMHYSAKVFTNSIVYQPKL